MPTDKEMEMEVRVSVLEEKLATSIGMLSRSVDDIRDELKKSRMWQMYFTAIITVVLAGIPLLRAVHLIP